MPDPVSTCGRVAAAWAAMAALVLGPLSCGRQAVQAVTARTAPASVPAASEPGVVRASGLVQATRSLSIRVPQISQTGGQGGRLTITYLARSGAQAAEGDVLVEFDRTSLLDQEIEAKAKVAELEHQLEEKKAQIESDAAKREALLREAEADLGKARLQLRKGPVLSEIERLQNEARAKSAAARVESLKKSNASRVKAEEAAVKIQELKRQRQQVMLERIQTNLSRLVIKAPQNGMVALENIWRSGSMGPPQVGDQPWPGQPLVRIFDPTYMLVETTISEADYRFMKNAARARVYLDAYPDAVFDAELDTASLVATAGLDSPVRSFVARFRVVQQDPRLLPDLSASLEIRRRSEVPRTALERRGGGRP